MAGSSWWTGDSENRFFDWLVNAPQIIDLDSDQLMNTSVGLELYWDWNVYDDTYLWADEKWYRIYFYRPINKRMVFRDYSISV